MSPNPFTVTMEMIEAENAVLQQIKAALKEARSHEALIGIPEESNAAHETEAGGSITNAELLYIHEHGSPVNKIPPRKVLELSQTNNKELIGEQMQAVLDQALGGNSDGAMRELERAGMLGASKARGWFVDSANGWAANQPATIKGKGSDKPLIDSGELRKSITSVVRRKGETK